MTPSELEASWQSIRNLAAQQGTENTFAVVSQPSSQLSPSLIEQFISFRRSGIPSHKLLFEICCESGSMLGTRASLHGFFTIRITASHDFANPETVDHICQFASHEQSSHAHSSIPCTPWSRFQALNAAMSNNTRKYKQRLGRQRAASRTLVANVQLVFDVISGSKSFEWPSTALDGWTDKTVVSLVECTPLPNQALVSACACGSLHPNGKPFGKKFLFKCSSEEVAVVLSTLECPGGHVHEPTQGQYTAPSANYTSVLADCFFCGLSKHNAVRGLASGTFAVAAQPPEQPVRFATASASP
jgi:hypothetical protein